MPNDLVERTFPLSHKSACPALSCASLLAAVIRYALCLTPRDSDSSCQERRGYRFSTPKGRVRWSVFRFTTRTRDFAFFSAMLGSKATPAVALLMVRNSRRSIFAVTCHL